MSAEWSSPRINTATATTSSAGGYASGSGCGFEASLNRCTWTVTASSGEYIPESPAYVSPRSVRVGPWNNVGIVPSGASVRPRTRSLLMRTTRAVLSGLVSSKCPSLNSMVAHESASSGSPKRRRTSNSSTTLRSGRLGERRCRWNSGTRGFVSSTQSGIEPLNLSTTSRFAPRLLMGTWGALGQVHSPRVRLRTYGISMTASRVGLNDRSSTNSRFHSESGVPSRL